MTFGTGATSLTRLLWGQLKLESPVMSSALRFCMLVFCAGLSLWLAASVRAEAPPLLDRALFFADADISGAQISADGRYITFIRPFNGTRNLWIKELGAGFDSARPLTADTRPVPGYFWSRDSRYVLYVQDRGGDENFHIWRVDVSAPPDPVTGVPEAVNLTDIDGVLARILRAPIDRPDTLVVALNDRDPALHDVFELSISTGERTRILENRGNFAGFGVDDFGQVRVAVRLGADGGMETLLVENNQVGELIVRCSWQETCSVTGFERHGTGIYFISDVGDDNDLSGLYRFDTSLGSLELIERDPENEVDFSGMILSVKTGELLATVYTGDRDRVYPKNDDFAALLADLREQLPDGELGLQSWTADEQTILVSVSSDIDPGSVYLYDRANDTARRLYQSRPDLPSEHLAHMQPIRYQARDGLEIPGYLTLPRGVAPQQLPLVAVIHGGPWARDYWGYDREVQFLANRGYAVFQPNFRASTGFGKAFLNAGNNQWGDAMQDDITDGIQWLVEQGIVDPQRVCIMGGSYGGYATLAGMVFTPELYACGVNIVGVSNLITLLNSIPTYWGPQRQIFTLRMGDIDTPEGRAQLERQSPINYVDRIARPLLVIHGANDPRVRQSEADQIVHAMHAAGLDVEYLVAPDEGHGFRGAENLMAMYARTEAFLANHLGGRFQPDMPEAIAERLAAITVDPATVEPPRAADGLEAAKLRPLPLTDAQQLAHGRFAYQTTLDLGEMGDITLDSVMQVRADSQGSAERLVLDVVLETPGGQARDEIVLDGQTLQPVSRRLLNGPVEVQVAYADRNISGHVETGGQQRPIQLALDAPAFADGMGLLAALAGLPLEPGFNTSIRVSEVTDQQRVRFFAVRVDAPVHIEVPAGAFETWPVHVEALDGEGEDQTFWFDTETPRKLVKLQGRLPLTMGGGLMTRVLVSQQ